MFCKNCGSEIKDGTKFCPKCGKAAMGGVSDSGGRALIDFDKAADMGRTSGTDKAADMGRTSGTDEAADMGRTSGIDGTADMGRTSGTDKAADMGRTSGTDKAADMKVHSKKGLWKILLTSAAVIAVIAGVVWYNSQKQYSIVGEWKSIDLVNAGEILNNYLEESQGEDKLEEWQANLIKETIGNYIGAAANNLTLVFYDRGEYGIFTGGARLSVFDLSYEQMQNQKLNLNWKLNMNVGVSGGIIVANAEANLDVPITLSYNAKCRVGKNIMTLDFFGYELTFQRQ